MSSTFCFEVIWLTSYFLRLCWTSNIRIPSSQYMLNSVINKLVFVPWLTQAFLFITPAAPSRESPTIMVAFFHQQGIHLFCEVACLTWPLRYLILCICSSSQVCILHRRCVDKRRFGRCWWAHEAREFWSLTSNYSMHLSKSAKPQEFSMATDLCLDSVWWRARQLCHYVLEQEQQWTWRHF